jgi:hypothetical protein
VQGSSYLVACFLSMDGYYLKLPKHKNSCKNVNQLMKKTIRPGVLQRIRHGGPRRRIPSASLVVPSRAYKIPCIAGISNRSIRSTLVFGQSFCGCRSSRHH